MNLNQFIMLKPTLKEVKEYFKDAKIIDDFTQVDNICDISESDIYENTGCFWAENPKGLDVYLWRIRKGYSKIVEYKSNALEEIEVIFTLTGEVEELSNYQKAMASVEALIPDDLETRHKIYTIIGELSVQGWKEGYDKAKANYNK